MFVDCGLVRMRREGERGTVDVLLLEPTGLSTTKSADRLRGHTKGGEGGSGGGGGFYGGGFLEDSY